jgi:MoxR-like ATPase
MSSDAEVGGDIPQFQADFQRLREAIGQVVIGQQEVLELTLAALFGGGHVLLEGPPGVGKTLLGRTLAHLLDVAYRRIQFTSDLMPSDIIGTYIVMESQGRRRFEFQQGPIFTNLLLADEINRATPKTQAALFEALEEGSLSVANEVYELPTPFFAIATQSLGDIEGTFPVPETQLDRFFFQLNMAAPTGSDLETILRRTTGPEPKTAATILNDKQVAQMTRLARQITVAPELVSYVARLVAATDPHGGAAPSSTRRLVLRGASPRAGLAMLRAGQVLAAADGRSQVAREDLQRVALPALRHRVSLNFEGHAEEAGIDGIINEILTAVK